MLHSRFWQAFFALAPIVLLFVTLAGYGAFLYFIFKQIPLTDHDPGGNSFYYESGRHFLFWFFAYLTFMILVSFGSLAFYIIHAVKNPNLQNNSLLVVWILLFIFVSGLGQLIYWIVEILGKSKITTASS